MTWLAFILPTRSRPKDKNDDWQCKFDERGWTDSVQFKWRYSKNAPSKPRVTEEFPYSSIAKVKYFTEIEQICLDKSISTENLDQFFKAHWLRIKWGSFARAQEMLAAYKQYVDEVPEEARAIEIPDQIKDAFSDFTAFITGTSA